MKARLPGALAVVLAVGAAPAAIAQSAPAGRCSLGADVKAVLEAAEEVEVFSLDPAAEREGAKALLHGSVVLGSTKVSKEAKARAIKEVTAAVEAATVE